MIQDYRFQIVPTAIGILILGGGLMSHEHDHGDYLTSEATVDTIYSHIQAGNLDAAESYLKGLGDDKVVVNTWVGVQCDINNTRHDPDASAAIAERGIAYCLGKGYKLPAAMTLHNISAFLMPEFDENVSLEHAAKAVDAAYRQVQTVPDPGVETPGAGATEPGAAGL